MYKDLIKILKQAHKKNIVIYGKPEHKEKVFFELSAFVKVYFMDLEEDSMIDNVMRLTSFQQAEQYKVDGFILVRQLIFHQDIFSHMMEYCKNHNADIYDLYGRKLSEICQEAMWYKFRSQEQILVEIDKHTCISFDIFDTLLQRQVLVPEDVFEITERRAAEEGIFIKDFKNRRIKSQQELGMTNPDIYDIYNNFHEKYKVSQEVLTICRNIEIQVEKDVIIPRKNMLDLYYKCLKKGKKIVLISDMYIPKIIMQDILDQNGITGYDALYVSCDKKQLKLEGLLERYKEDYLEESYFHIGDHRIHDGICARLAGIEYCLVASGIKMAQQTIFKECIEKSVTLEEHIMLGMVIAKIMDSPFQKGWQSGDIFITSDYEYGYCFCAVLLCQFVFWICENAKRNNYEAILFASRDGYLIQKMYRMIQVTSNQNLPPGKYFYTSRKAAVLTGINNEAFVNMIIRISEGMIPERILTERFGLSPEQVLPYNKEEYEDSIHQYVWKHVDKIFKRANEAKTDYFKYMGNIGLKIGKKYAFMDFVSSGTCQKSLKRISPFEIEGLYAGWNGTDDREDIGVHALYEGSESYFMKNYKMMETFMTSDEPSLSHFDVRGLPVFMKQDRTKRELEYVEHMQKACLDFLNEFLVIMKVCGVKISNAFADSIFEAGGNVKVSDENNILNHLELTDDWKQERSKVKDLIQKSSGGKYNGTDYIE